MIVVVSQSLRQSKLDDATRPVHESDRELCKRIASEFRLGEVQHLPGPIVCTFGL